MTVVHNNASTTLPNTTAPFDITFSGGSPFTYTGGGLYVAFDWQWAGPVTTTAVVACNSALSNGLRGAQSNSVPPPSLGGIESPAGDPADAGHGVHHQRRERRFRDRSRLAGAAAGRSADRKSRGDQSRRQPVGQSAGHVQPLGGRDLFERADSSRRSPRAGARRPFRSRRSLRRSSESTPSRFPCRPTIWSATTRKSRQLNETFNLYSYKHPASTPNGGTGISGATGTMVAKFTITAAAKVSAVSLEFFAISSATYRVAIYPDSGSGTPGIDSAVRGFRQPEHRDDLAGHDHARLPRLGGSRGVLRRHPAGHHDQRELELRQRGADPERCVLLRHAQPTGRLVRLLARQQLQAEHRRTPDSVRHQRPTAETRTPAPTTRARASCASTRTTRRPRATATPARTRTNARAASAFPARRLATTTTSAPSTLCNEQWAAATPRSSATTTTRAPTMRARRAPDACSPRTMRTRAATAISARRATSARAACAWVKAR